MRHDTPVVRTSCSRLLSGEPKALASGPSVHVGCGQYAALSKGNADKAKAREIEIEVAKEQIRLLQGSLEKYRRDLNAYPATDQGLEALWHAPADLPDESRWTGPYFDGAMPADPWGNPYLYEAPGRHNPDSFDLWSMGPDGVNDTQDDITNWSERLVPVNGP